MKKKISSHTYFYLIIFICITIASILVFNIYERNKTYRNNQHLLAKKSVTGLSKSIDLYIQGLRQRVYLLTDQEQTLIAHLANDPNDILAYQKLDDKISLHFSQHFSWTIAASNGHALLESFDHLVGKGCRQDIKKFATDTQSNQIYIHSSPQNKPYHFDMMVLIQRSQRVFFISFNLTDLTNMIRNSEIPRHHLLLLKQGHQGLIEVTAEGAFDSIIQNRQRPLWQTITHSSKITKKNDLKLSNSALLNLEFFMPIPGTKWVLADLPDTYFYSTQEKLRWFKAGFIFIILSLISSLIILLIKKRQDQFLLFNNEQKQQEFINSSPVMMWINQAPKQNLIYNNAWLKFSNPDQLQNTSQPNNVVLIHPDDQEQFSVVRSKGLETQTPFALEYRQLNKNLQFRWIRETAVPRFNEKNNYQGHTGICIDITDNKLNDETDKVLFSLLKHSFEPIDDFLNKSIQTILSIPWLSLENQAGIFLVDDESEKPSLKMVCSHNLHHELISLCSKIDFGHCLCGRAALLKSIQFATCIDDRHETRFQGMRPHGHYNVPLMHGEQLLGVMVLYLEHGHKQRAHEIQFLEHTSQILGLGISKHKAELQVRKQAYYDDITNLPNRYLLMESLQKTFAESSKNSTKSALIFIDLDHFKNINDSLGHMIGDQVLEQIAQRFLSVLQKQDTLARYSGDEFVILLKSIDANKEKAIIKINHTIKKLQHIITKDLQINRFKLSVKMSMGIAIIPDDGNNEHEILSHADAAMYQAKKTGRNTYTFFSEQLQQQANEKRQLEQGLRLAIKQDQLILYYQPQMDESGLITGLEALIRWDHPQNGFINPAIFIPIAEESGQILEIGNWVLNTACQQFKKFCDANSSNELTHIAVNISVHQLRHPDFFQQVEQAIHQSNIQPQQLTLEVTESVMVMDTEDTIQKMHQLKQLGICFSMDDFGTGYSSLSYLKRLPLDQLKIDKSFVDDIESDSNDRIIVATIIAMSHHLNLNIIAEGVENANQVKYLKQAGCNNFQGYFYSRPIPAEKVIVLLT